MCASFFTRVRPRGGVGWWQSSVRIRRHRISMWRSASMPLLVMVLHLTSGFYLPGAAVQHVATSRPPHPFRVPPVICEVQISDKDDAEHMAAAARAEALDHMRHRRLREASVALQGLARMRTLDSEVCHAAFEAFVKPAPQHRLLASLATLIAEADAPPPLWPGAAEVFTISCAEQGLHVAALDWWDAALRDAAAGGEPSTDARDAALVSSARLGRWEQAERLFSTIMAAATYGKGRGLRAVVEACSRQTDAPAELARRAFVAAAAAGLADADLLRDALQASAKRGEHAAGLELLRTCASGGGGDDAADALVVLSRTSGVQRVAAALHAGCGEVDAALRSMRRVRRAQAEARRSL